MILVVSDLHLGKNPNSDLDSLLALEDCVSATGASEVIFLGDVFDAFIESDRHLPPIVKTWGELAGRLIDRDIRLHYLMGNHDRWHRRYVKSIIGEAPVRDGIQRSWGSGTVHLEHGDRGHGHRLPTRTARWLSDQPWMHRLYTTLMPMGGAQALAAAVSRRFASFEPDPHLVEIMRRYAVRILRDGDASGVVMGHCHQVGLFDLSSETGQHSWYANSGDWYEHRSFVLLGADLVSVCCWRDGKCVTLSSMPLNPSA